MQGGTFVFSSPNYEPLGPGKHRFFFEFAFREGSETVSYEIDPLQFQDGTHGYRFAFGADLLPKFARARSVTLSMSDGRALKDVSLKGSGNAIKALEECAGQFEPALIADPGDGSELQPDKTVTGRCVNQRAVFVRGTTRVKGGECLEGMVFYTARTFSDGRTIILQNASSSGMINPGTAIFIAENGTARTYENLYVTEWLDIWSPRYVFFRRASTGNDGDIFNPYIQNCEIEFDWANMRPLSGPDKDGEIASSCSDPL